jgi:hypothetical protein
VALGGAFDEGRHRDEAARRPAVVSTSTTRAGAAAARRPKSPNGVGEFVFFDVLFDVKLRQPILDRFDEFATLGGLHLFRRKGGGNVR